MIGNDPNIDKFIHEYATSKEVMSLDKWGERYGVHRHTVAKWIKEHSIDIEELNKEARTEFDKNIQRLGEKAIEVINRALDEGDEKIAVQILPYLTPKKESLEANIKQGTDEWIVELDKANVAGGQ
jgi:hypothetical protein